MRSSALALLFAAYVLIGCGLATTPLPIPAPGRALRVEVTYFRFGTRTGEWAVTDPEQAEAICAALRELNTQWLPSYGPDADRQVSVLVRGEGGAMGFWIGSDWMGASMPGDFVLMKRYRRLSSDERAALGRVLTPQ